MQKRPEPIGKTIDSIRILLKPWLGDPKWKITERSAKLIYKYESINKVSTKLKIEINTTEHFQVLLLRVEKFDVQSEWVNGSAGFGAWRELATHVMTTNWVITGECANFPIMYHFYR